MLSVQLIVSNKSLGLPLLPNTFCIPNIYCLHTTPSGASTSLTALPTPPPLVRDVTDDSFPNLRLVVNLEQPSF